MFGLIRRLSHSVIPRPDRPWEDDRTLHFRNYPRFLLTLDHLQQLPMHHTNHGSGG